MSTKRMWTVLLWSLTVLLCFTLSLQSQPRRGGRGGRGGYGGMIPYLLANHKQIERQVKFTPNGVQTITLSKNPTVAKAIQQHVAAMHRRLKTGMALRRGDPLFAALFKNAGKIHMTWKLHPQGIIVEETSKDPYTVKLIEAHATVVSLFVKKGIAEASQRHAIP